MHNFYWYSFSFLFVVHSTFTLAQPPKKTIHVATYADGGGHRIEVINSFFAFEKANPSINIKFSAMRGVEQYNQHVKKWLSEGKGPDIFFWYSGSRIQSLANQGLIHDLDNFIEKYQLEKNYPPSILNAISANNKYYAIPNSVLLWSLYYNKDVLNKLHINLPKNWQDLISTCKLLREKNIDLFSIGTKNSEWVTHGWFDYLILRIHGLTFYKQLINGKVPYTDKRVKTVFLHWKTLIDNQCFNSDFEQYNIWESFPKILRSYSAFTLIDGIPTGITDITKYDVGIFEFPEVTPNLSQFSVQPVNVFIVPSYTTIDANLEKVLLHLSNAKFQTVFNLPIKKVPPHKQSIIGDLNLLTTAQKIIQNSPGSVQFFDRETSINFAQHTPYILVDFMKDGDIQKVQNRLETLRRKVFNIPVN